MFQIPNLGSARILDQPYTLIARVCVFARPPSKAAHFRKPESESRAFRIKNVAALSGTAIDATC